LKKNKKPLILAIAIYLLLNGLVWGCMKVYTESYNIMNSNKIVMADVKFNNNNAELTVLNKKLVMNTPVLPQDNPVFLGAYLFSSEKTKLLTDIIKLVNSYTALK
jgi:hypothetical protein